MFSANLIKSLQNPAKAIVYWEKKRFFAPVYCWTMMRTLLKWGVGILLVPVILFLLAATLLYMPPVQDYVVQRAALALSRTTGMKVDVARLRLTFLLDLDLQGVTVTDAERDILLDVEHLTVDLSLVSLLRGEVDVESVELVRAAVNTKRMIAGVTVKGRLERFCLDSHGVSLKEETVTVNHAGLNGADIEVALNDTITPEDTTTSVVNWRIDLQQVELARTRVTFSMPGDSMRVQAGIGQALLTDGRIDLGRNFYTVRQFSLAADSLFYDLPYVEPVEGFDVNHIALHDIALTADSVEFDGNALALALAFRNIRMTEKCGLAVNELEGRFAMDSVSLHLPYVNLRTSDSYLRAQADMDFAAVEACPGGRLSLRLLGELGKQDVLTFAGGMPPAFVRAYPNRPLELRVSMDGNVEHLELTAAEARLAGVFDMKAEGRLANLLDSLGPGADVGIALRTGNLSMVKALADGALDGIALPPMLLNGRLKADGPRYNADLRLAEGAGRVGVKASYDAARTAYKATLDVDSINLHHFLPQDSLYAFSMTARAEGVGTDFLSPRTRMNATAEIQRLEYAGLDFCRVKADAFLDKGVGHVTLDSDNPILNMTSRIDAMLSRLNTDLTFTMDVRRVDLHALRVTEKSFAVGMCMHMDGATNLKDSHSLQGDISDISLTLSDTVFHPKELQVDVLAMPDTTYADIRAGDFKLKLTGHEGYEQLMAKAQDFMAAAEAQAARRYIDQDSLRLLLPHLALQLSSGRNNPVCNFLLAHGYSFEDLDFVLTADPAVGLNGGGHLHTMKLGGVTLDTLQLHIFQDSTGVKMDGRLRNGPKNKQIVFDSRMNAWLHSTGAGVNFVYLDDKGRKGVDFGLVGGVTDSGVRITFSQARPIIAYRKFEINEDNYIYMGNDGRVEADVDLLADDGTAAHLFSTPNPEALQDLSLNLHNLNVGELMSVIPYAPRITGMMEGDAHLIQTSENLSVVLDLLVNGMAYEGAALGNVGLNGVYLPNEDGSHFVDAFMTHDGDEVLALSGSYIPGEKNDSVEADLKLVSFPLSMANGFVPDRIASLSGTADGEFFVGGSTAKPRLDGWLSTTDMRVLSPEYSLNLRLEDDTIRVAGNRLNLEKLNVYSTGKRPLVFDGTVDFADLENVLLDLNVNARNFELINAKRTTQSAAYGKVYVDVAAMVTGSLNDMNVSGRLGVLGTTDVSYILKDSPLSAEDRLEGLVTFMDFSDTTSVENEEKSRPTNMSVFMLVNIDQGAQVHCLLSPDRSKYVDLEGGGELTLNYNQQGELTLNGRYTVLSGEMKYSLPVIPLKTFTIASGSYVDFNGPVMNPTLNIAATERVRATVTENDVPRTVAFDVGLTITQTLENMGLEFTLAAPEDMNLQNELAAMSVERRGRLAVTMLATGMYLADNGNGSMEGFSTTNAMNALLQAEISKIAGKALETIDLSLGVENAKTAEGNSRTDYSFRFAKRLWGNRVSIIIGGQVSTGEDVENTGQSLINNVSLEYRLDKSATRYVTLFYDKNYESLLEGEITEMGAGLVLRRKMTRLGELFIFRNRKREQPVGQPLKQE